MLRSSGLIASVIALVALVVLAATSVAGDPEFQTTLVGQGNFQGATGRAQVKTRDGLSEIRVEVEGLAVLAGQTLQVEIERDDPDLDETVGSFVVQPDGRGRFEIRDFASSLPGGIASGDEIQITRDPSGTGGPLVLLGVLAPK